MATTVGHAQIPIGPELNNIMMRRFEAALRANMNRIERQVRPNIEPALDIIQYRRKLQAATAKEQQQKINAALDAIEYRRNLKAMTSQRVIQEIDTQLKEASYRAKLKVLTRPVSQTVNVDVDRAGLARMAALGGLMQTLRGRVFLLRTSLVALRPLWVGFFAAIVAALPVIINLIGHLGLAAGAILGGLVPAMFAAVGAGAALLLGFRGVADGSKLLTKEAARAHGAMNNWKRIADELAISFQKRALPGVENFLNSARILVPQVDAFFIRFGNTVRRVSNDLANFVTSDVFQNQFRTVMEGNNRALDSLGNVAVSVFRILSSLAAGAVAQFERFAHWLDVSFEKMADFLETREQTGQLREDFQKMGDAAAQWGRILGNLFVTVFNILKAISPISQQTADEFERLTARWREFTGSTEGQEKIRQFFQDLKEFPWGTVAKGMAGIAIALAAINVGRSITALAGLFAPVAALGTAATAAGIALGVLTVVLVGLTAAFGFLYFTNEDFRNSINATAQDIGQKLQPVLEVLGTFWREKLEPAIIEFTNTILPALQVGISMIADAFMRNNVEMGQLIDILAVIIKFMGVTFANSIIFVSAIITGLIETVGFLIRSWNFLWEVGKNIVNFLVTSWNVSWAGATTILRVFRDFVVGAWNFLWNLARTVFGGIASTVSGIWNGLWNGLRSAWNSFWGFLRGAWQGALNLARSVWNGITSAISSAWGAIRGIFNAIGNAIRGPLGAAWNFLRDRVSSAWESMRRSIRSVWDWVWRNVISKIINLPSTIGNALRGLAGALSGPFKAAFNAISRAWNDTVGKLSWSVPDWVPGIGGKSISAPKLPTLATGGLIQGMGTGTSDSIMAMVSNGEFVVRADAVQQVGVDFLQAVNTGALPRFATGGTVGTVGAQATEAPTSGPPVDIAALAEMLQVLPGFNQLATVLMQVVNNTAQLRTAMGSVGGTIFEVNAALMSAGQQIATVWQTADIAGAQAVANYQAHLATMQLNINTFVAAATTAWRTWHATNFNDIVAHTTVATAMWQQYYTVARTNQHNFILQTTADWRLWHATARVDMNNFATAQQARWQLMHTQHRQTWLAFRPTVDTEIPAAFTTFRNRSITLFQQTASGIRTEWDKIEGYTKEPVRFVVSTVYNTALGNLFTAAKKIFTSMPAFSRASLPGGFASGGIYPGYTPGRDIGLAAVSGGEAIMRPEWTRALGPETIHAMNAAARRGGVEGVRKFFGGYFTGGIVSEIGARSRNVLAGKYEPGGFIESSRFAATATSLEKGIDSITPDESGARHFSRRTGVSLWDMFLEKMVAMDVPVIAGGSGGDQGIGSSALLQAMAAFVRSVAPGMRVSSGYRPGDPGYHGRQRAIDMIFSDGSQNRSSGQRPGGQAARAAEAITRTFMARTLELIWDPLGNQAIWNGRRHRFTGGGAGPGTHNDHIHWAFGGSPEDLKRSAAGGGGSWSDSSEFYKAAKFGTLKNATGLYKKAKEAIQKAKAAMATAGLVSGDGSVMQQAYRQAKSMGASNKVLLALFMAGFVESGFRNLGHGDRDSIGFLQQRPSQGWGTRSQIMNVPFATRSFVSRAMAIERSRGSGIGAGALAQAVQRSAFPGRYEQNRSRAIAALRRLEPGIRFDQGGVLGPGDTSATNLTGQPEAVLTNQQWAAMLALADSADKDRPIMIENHHYIDGKEIDVRTDARIAEHDKELVRVLRSNRKRN